MGKAKIVEYMLADDIICSYGCGSIAKVKFTNGKFCCSISNNSCSAVVSRNSINQLGNKHKTGKTQTAWNKGLTSDNDSRIIAGLLHPNNGKKWGAALTGHTKETKEKLSEIMSTKMNNRYTASIRAEYKGIKFESSWEIELAKDLDKNNINWVRPLPLVYIDDSGQTRRYYPDFYLIDKNVYLDPKNPYVQKLDKRKFELVIQQNNVRLIMLNKEQLNWQYIESQVLR